MKCPRCHVALPNNTRFCPSCGLAVEQSEVHEMPYIGAHFVQVPPQEPEPVVPPEPVAQQVPVEDEVVHEEVLEEASKSVPDEDVAEPVQTAEPDAADQAESVPSEEPASRAGDPDPAPGTAPGYDVAYAPPMESAKLIGPPRRMPKVIIAVLAVGALGLGGWAGYNALKESRAREEQEQRVQAAEAALQTPQAVDVVLGIPNSSDSIDMPVALHIVGQTRAGSSVDEVSVITFDDRELSLLPGRYDVSLVGKVISSEGKMYSGSVDSYGITVGLDEEYEATLAEGSQKGSEENTDGGAASEGNAPVATFPIFVFGEIAPQDIQDADIESVRAWLMDAGIDPTPYIDAALARRAEAIEELNAEAAARLEEEARQAEEAARAAEQAAGGAEGQQETANPEGGEPAAEQPVAEQPAAEQPVAEQPAAEQPVVEQPAAEQPVAEQPAAEQPVAEQPAAEQPAAV